MKTVFMTPGVTTAESFEALRKRGTKARFLMTDPLVQAEPLKKIFPDAETLTEEHFLDLDDDACDALNAQAKQLARDWYRLRPVEEAGIELGALLTHAMTYAFVGWLKALVFCEAFFQKEGPSQVVILDDGSYWSEACRMVSRRYGIPCESLTIQKRAAAGSWKRVFKAFIRGFLSAFGSLGISGMPPHGVLYSSAPRYAWPLIRKGDYYLREDFSWEGWNKGLRTGFYHLLPETGGAVSPLPSGALQELENAVRASGRYRWQSHDLWPLMRPAVTRALTQDFPRAVKLIRFFNRLFERLRPRAVVVDEDVCFFNKALVLSAKRRGIPTYTFVHGVPYFDVGFAPASSETLFVWGNRAADRLKHWGIPEPRLQKVGAPQYAPFSFRRVTPELRSRFGIPTGKTAFLLATQPFHTNEHPDFFGSWVTEKNMAAMITSVLEFAAEEPRAFVLLKLHPRERRARFTDTLLQPYREKLRGRLRVIHQADIADCILASDAVLSLGSTVYFEALLLKKPAFLFDDPKKRYFDFMSPDFLNLNDPEAAARRLSAFVEHPDQPKGPDEIQEHFFAGNTEALRLCRKILYEGRISQTLMSEAPIKAANTKEVPSHAN